MLLGFDRSKEGHRRGELLVSDPDKTLWRWPPALVMRSVFITDLLLTDDQHAHWCSHASQSASSVNVRNSRSGRTAPAGRSPFRLIQATGMPCATPGVTSWK